MSLPRGVLAESYGEGLGEGARKEEVLGVRGRGRLWVFTDAAPLPLGSIYIYIYIYIFIYFLFYFIYLFMCIYIHIYICIYIYMHFSECSPYRYALTTTGLRGAPIPPGT